MKKIIIALSIVGLVGMASIPQKAHAGLLSSIIVGAISHSYGVDSGKAQQQGTDALTIANLNTTIASLNIQITSLQNALNMCQQKLPIKKNK